MATREFGIRDLRNDTNQVLAALDRGDTVYLTKRGRRVAHLLPVPSDDRSPVQRLLDKAAALPKMDTGAVAELIDAKRADTEAQARKDRALWG